MPRDPSPQAPFRLVPIAVAVVVALLGWWNTSFFCDDAFINYRYCGNAYDGHGFVWNPAPFAAVEGYTSFGWVALLYLVWIATGLEPPQTAIPITLSCGLVMLWVLGKRLETMALPERLQRWRPWFAGAVLLGIAGNHTFCTWLSSGMETSMFALLVVLWTLRALPIRDGARARDVFALGVWAALAHLIRPDGGLLVLGTLAIGAEAWWARSCRGRAALLALLPAVVPVVHVFWRRCYYGDWLPNPWHAKVVGAWPESGLRYLYCFCIEHGVWLWLPLALGWLLMAALRGGVLRTLFVGRFPATVAVGACLAHTGYYTLVVGGDHFAYRVFVQLVPLMLLCSLAMVASLRLPRAAALGYTVLLSLAADVPGWWMERALVGREADGFVRAAPTVPSVLRPLLSLYDHCQAWLHVHSVGFRRATHAYFCAAVRADLPNRARGQIEGGPPGVRLVYRADAVGVVSWALADVVILDGKGLNDWVIARHRGPRNAPAFDPAVLRAAFPTFDIDRDQRLSADELAAVTHLLVSIGPALRPVVWVEILLSLADGDGDAALDVDELGAALAAMLPPRQMAHEREPPDGYIEALRPNVIDKGGRRIVMTEVVPLTDDEVRAVEMRYRQIVSK